MFLLSLESFKKTVWNSSPVAHRNSSGVITDRVPVDKKRKDIEKGVQLALADMLPQGERKYKILHHTSRSHYGLQIADYCCWAVYRKWDRNEMKCYDTIKEAIRSEFDIFSKGNTYYY